MLTHISPHLRGILAHLSTSPGVYQMKDKKNEVIYVGKAKNLKSRVNSYFQRTEDLSGAKRQMVDQIVTIEVTLTKNEAEALVLETNLIKHLRPKYNILMKDDKNLAYIKVTHSPVPEVMKTRKKLKDRGIYFWPYVSGIENSLQYIRKLFRVRNCRVKFEKKYGEIRVTDKAWRTLPCMDYYIWLCPAPCTLEKEKMDIHRENIEQMKEFLRGKMQNVLKKVEEEMYACAKNLDFEGAEKRKVTLEWLRALGAKQSVRDKTPWNHDTIVLYEKNGRSFIGITLVREWQVVGNNRYELTSRIDTSVEEKVESMIAAHYIDETRETENIPDTLILEHPITDNGLEMLLREKKIRIDTPLSWPRQELLTFTKNQLREYAYKSELATLEHKTLTKEHMRNILIALGYTPPKIGPIRFECYDISHTHWHFTTASRVVIENGKTMNHEYRKYTIKTLSEGMIDDFASHREVMLRRTLEWLERNNFPHLIIIDGGKWQLSSAESGIQDGVKRFREIQSDILHFSTFIDKSETMKEETHMYTSKYITQWISTIQNGWIWWNESKKMNVWVPGNNTKNEEKVFSFTENIYQNDSYTLPNLCSIAKREEEVFVSWKSKPILFERWSGELMVLQKARDESHRFSITANRNKRTKSMKKNLLEELPWFWPTTRRKLLKEAGSIERIRELSLDILRSVCTKTQIEILRDHGMIDSYQ